MPTTCKEKVLKSDKRRSVITVRELRAICKHEKLKCSGTKEELCKRVIDHIRALESGVYTPAKYFTGLEPLEKVKRLHSIRRRDGFATDYTTDAKGKRVRRQTKPSTYTKAFQKAFPNAKSLKDKADATGIPLRILKKVYEKGVAAHRTGHRPGATAAQWGHARVHSFIMKGCTYYAPDHTLVAEAKKQSPKARSWWASVRKMCRK